MSTKLIETSLILIVWLFIATSSALAQSDSPPVLDIKGQPVEVGKEYYIITALYDLGGRITLINRNNSCPLYVGQENTDLAKGLPVKFTPFAIEDKVIKVNRDFRVAFAATTICVQSTQWKLGQRDPKSGRRLIITGTGNDTSNYFRIVKTQFEGIYNIQFCPTDVCPLCKFDCGTVGSLREFLNILLALDGNKLPIQFVRA